MIKFKLDLTVTEQEARGEKHAVLIAGPYEVNGKGVKSAEVLGIAEALGKAIELLMPQIENLPGNGALDFAVALNRPFDEWARKH